MAKKGGYKIIDLGGVNITTAGDAVTIAGIYDAIESTDKAILVSGLTIDNVDYSDVYGVPISGDNQYTISVYGKSLTVTSADAVSIPE